MKISLFFGSFVFGDSYAIGVSLRGKFRSFFPASFFFGDSSATCDFSSAQMSTTFAKMSLQDKSSNIASKKSAHRALSTMFSRPASHLGFLWRAETLRPISTRFAQPSPHLRCIFCFWTLRVTSIIFAPCVPSRFYFAVLLDDIPGGSWGSWPAPKTNDFQLKFFSKFNISAGS